MKRLTLVLAVGLLASACSSGASTSSEVASLVGAKATAHCPSQIPDLKGTNHANQLVPFQADDLLLCGYRPDPAQPFEKRVFDAATITTLEQEINALPAVPKGTMFCGKLSWRAYLAFSNGKRETDVVVEAGCATFTSVDHRSWAGDQGVGFLAKLLPSSFTG